jgi:hypothetical protein
MFSKIRGDICSSRFATGVKFLPSSSLSGISSLILLPLFATGVNDTGGKFAAGVVDTRGNLPTASLTPAANLPPVSLTPVANLPPVSTTQGELMAKFAAGVVDTAAIPYAYAQSIFKEVFFLSWGQKIFFSVEL